jgi:hypothetical protein
MSTTSQELTPNSSLPNLTQQLDLIQLFQSHVEQLGLVGESANAAVTFCVAVSAALDNPLHLTVCGASSAGKNYLLAAVAALIPDERKKFLSGMTKQSMMYSKKDEFKHKAIFIAEYEGVAKADFAIRTFQSEKVIDWDTVDNKHGLEKKNCRVEGPAAFLQATTRSVLHPENETRMLFVQMDESSAQTERILKSQAIRASQGSSVQPEKIQKLWQDFLMNLQLNQVRIPFAEKIQTHFPNERVRSRRDFPKLLELITNSAYLHQYVRQHDGDTIVASPEDYTIAKRMFEHCYSCGPDQALGDLLDAASKIDKEFSIADLIGVTGWGKTKTYDLVKRAEEELGCIAETETRGRYRLLRNSAVPPLKLPETI